MRTHRLLAWEKLHLPKPRTKVSSRNLNPLNREGCINCKERIYSKPEKLDIMEYSRDDVALVFPLRIRHERKIHLSRGPELGEKIR